MVRPINPNMQKVTASTRERLRFPGQHGGRPTFVSRMPEFLKSTFFRDPNRCQILRIDQAKYPSRPKVRFAPADHRANRLSGVAFAVYSGSEYPAQLRRAAE